jgi:Ca2+-binding EF-hand superfamily protein
MSHKIDENSAEDEIREPFVVFDSVSFHFISKVCQIIWELQDGNGFINRQELGYVMENLGEHGEEGD